MLKRISVKRWILGSLVILLMIGIGNFLYLYYKQPIAFKAGTPIETTEKPDLKGNLTQEQSKSDAAQMVTFLEETHPLFLEKQSQEYQESKKRFLEQTDQSLSVRAFRLLLSQYLSSLNDGHTRLSWADDSTLNVDWDWQGDRLWLDLGESMQKSEVVEIGGVPITTIVDQVDTLFPAENPSAIELNHSKYTKNKSVLEASGIDVTAPISIVLNNNGKVSTKEVSFTTAIPVTKEENVASIESKILQEVFVITMRMCNMDTELEHTVAQLENALANGIKHVVIDVRDNPGGNSNAVSKLIHAMSMKEGQFGSVIRFSKQASEQRGYLRKNGSLTFKPENNAKRNPNIDLYVLVNANTFSSANMLAVWVQDGHLGTLVGQPPSNSPSSFGDILYFQLDNSKLFGTVSHKKWTRPDASRNAQMELVPDIIVPNGKDALEVVLDQIAHK